MPSGSGKRVKKKSKKGSSKLVHRAPSPPRRDSSRQSGAGKERKSRKGREKSDKNNNIDFINDSDKGDDDHHRSYLAREREWEREQEHKKEWDRKQLEKLELERLRQLEQKRAIEIQQLQLQLQQQQQHKKPHRSRTESKRVDSGENRHRDGSSSKRSRKGEDRSDKRSVSRKRSSISSSRKGREHKDRDEKPRESKHCKDLRLNTTLNIRKPCTGKVEPIYNSHGKLIKFIVMRIENCSSCSIDISYYKHPTHRDEILAATVSPGSTVIVNISDAYSVFYQCCSCGGNDRDRRDGGLSSVGHSRIRSLYSDTRGTDTNSHDNTNDDNDYGGETLLMPHTTLTPIRSTSIASLTPSSSSTGSLLGQQQPHQIRQPTATKLCVMTIVIQAQVERP